MDLDKATPLIVQTSGFTMRIVPTYTGTRSHSNL